MRAAAANGNGQGPSWLLAAQQLLLKVLGPQDEVSRQHRATMAAAAGGGARPFSSSVDNKLLATHCAGALRFRHHHHHSQGRPSCPDRGQE